ALPSWLSFSGAARSFSGTPAAADAGTLAVRVTASDGKGGSATDDFSLTVSGGTSSGEAYRYNAGGPQETTSRGVFAADAFASGGSKKSPTTDAIAGTGDDAIYRSNRFGTAFSYNIPVKGGEYQVVLHFADLYWTAAGKRVFDVSIEGSKVLSAYDIVAKAGAGKAAAVESFTVNVTDGTLNIAFARLVDNALVSAIEVISNS
ncbi:malectin domain-containing carbohydrate-binding protein, partial [Rufibacter roseolus]|uniref:malectin domain-containing carbohydrate-binding protein n=1 Tax=Rufibacter roseolus TaxID=2817375 RepID=UPI001B3171D8